MIHTHVCGALLALSSVFVSAASGQIITPTMVTGVSSGPITVKVDVFIPAAESIDPTPVHGGVAKGDGRGFGEPGTSRVTQTVVIRPTGTYFLVQPQAPQIGRTEVMHWPSPGNPGGTYETGFADPSGINVEHSQYNASYTTRLPDWKLSFVMSGAATIPTNPLAMAIDYRLDGTLQGTTMTLQLRSDGYPAYEIFVNGKSVIRVNASRMGPLALAPEIRDNVANGIVYLDYNGGGGTGYNVNNVPLLDPLTYELIPYGAAPGDFGGLYYWDEATQTWILLTGGQG